MTAGVTALLIEGVSRSAMLRAQEVLINRALVRIHDDIRGKDGVIASVSKEINLGKDATWLHMSAVLRSIHSDSVRSQVFDAGISAAYASWAGAIDEKFFLSQKDVICFMKDGKTLFDDRSAFLKSRFRQPGFKTKIFIVHPDFEHIGAVAAMDEYSGEKKIQRSNLLNAIRTMNQIRSEIKLENGFDCRGTVSFVGYNFVPTWVGFIGNDIAYIHLYYSRPYRGYLNTLVIPARDGERATPWYRNYKDDFEQIERITMEKNSHSLWDYTIP